MPYCIHCGAQNAPEAEFCIGCGKSVKEAVAKKTPTPAPTKAPAPPQKPLSPTPPKASPLTQAPQTASKTKPNTLSVLFLTVSLILVLSMFLLPWFEFKYSNSTYTYSIFGDDNPTLVEKEIGSSVTVFFIFTLAATIAANAFQFCNRKGLSALFSVANLLLLIICMPVIFSNWSEGKDSLGSGMILNLIFSVLLVILSLISALSDNKKRR